MADIQMGKYVSMLLRHRPEEAGVVLDEHGWTDVADLVAKVKPKYPDISEELLHEMAFAPDKQRYEFSEDNKRIRAALVALGQPLLNLLYSINVHFISI